MDNDEEKEASSAAMDSGTASEFQMTAGYLAVTATILVASSTFV